MTSFNLTRDTLSFFFSSSCGCIGVDFDWEPDIEDEPDGIYFDYEIKNIPIQFQPKPNSIQINHYLHLHDLHQLH